MAKYKPSFDVRHMMQMVEIDKALQARGEKKGLLPYLQELISRLTSGGVAGATDDIREMQAKRYVDLGFARELKALGLIKHASLRAYIETIPKIPEHMLEDDTDFPLLVLVDPRLGLIKTCELAFIYFGGNDQTFVPWDKDYVELTEPYWIRIQDGSKNQNTAPKDCRKRFANHEKGLTAFQGVASFIQHPDIIKQGEHVMDLHGSVHSVRRGLIAFLGVWHDRPRLNWRWVENSSPGCGSVSLREYNL